MIQIVTFTDSQMTQSADLCVRSARKHGADNALIWTQDALRQTEFYQQNKTLLDQPRGCGYWCFKPYIISVAMTCLIDVDVLIYSDAGVEFIDNVNHIIDRMDQDIFLFANNCDHAHWCKRDIIEEIMPKIGWEFFDWQVQASVIFFRVNDKTRAFVKEWLDYCLVPGLIDDSPSKAPNHPEFRENRHDQAILTTLAYREGYRLHWWPAIYNDGAFRYESDSYIDEGYPPLFLHHRRRNREWTNFV